MGTQYDIGNCLKIAPSSAPEGRPQAGPVWVKTILMVHELRDNSIEGTRMTATCANAATWLEAGYFTANLAEAHSEIYTILTEEFSRQRNQSDLIVRKTFTSLTEIRLMGSIIASTVVKDYSGRRYRAGTTNVAIPAVGNSNRGSKK